MFTDGNARQYETLMKEIPRKSPKHSGKKASGLKYKYADMDCDYCLYCRMCKFGICPYIMEFIDDLMEDKAFIRAVKRAESCLNGHRQTLISIKQEVMEGRR